MVERKRKSNPKSRTSTESEFNARIAKANDIIIVLQARMNEYSAEAQKLAMNLGLKNWA